MVNVRARKRTVWRSMPDVLVIHLKRFTNAQLKIGKHVDFIEELDWIGVPFNEAKKKFKLFAVVAHQGSSHLSGHYIAFINVPNRGWHRFNDERITPSSWEQVRHQQAYLLWYEHV